MAAAHVPYLLATVHVGHSERLGAEQLEGHHVVALAMLPHRHAGLVARLRAVRYAIAARFARGCRTDLPVIIFGNFPPAATQRMPSGPP